jgi:hypothetical protein
MRKGWKIAAVVVGADDAVLIGNRFDRSVPIVDEVLGAGELPLGARAAVEVASPGATVAELSDPLRLAVLLGLGPDEARAARSAARAVAASRAAIVVRTPTSEMPSAHADASVVLVRAEAAKSRSPSGPSRQLPARSRPSGEPRAIATSSST